MSRATRIRASLAALAVAMVAGACMPSGATTQGQSISSLYTVFMVGGIIVAAIVWSLTTWAVLRYRHRDGREAPQTQGSMLIEAIWTGIPLATVLALFVLTVVTLGSIDAVEPGGVNIRVVAFRWQWQVQYSDSGVTDTGTGEHPLELVLPVNTPVHVTLESLDVNHAFFIPAFLFKRDAIPGHVTHFDIQITQPGTYPGACAEFCGLSHDDMLFSVRAVDMATYQAWMAGRAAGASAAPGPGGSAGPSLAPGASGVPGTSGAPGAGPGSSSPAASGAPGASSAASPGSSSDTSGASGLPVNPGGSTGP